MDSYAKKIIQTFGGKLTKFSGNLRDLEEAEERVLGVPVAKGAGVAGGRPAEAGLKGHRTAEDKTKRLF